MRYSRYYTKTNGDGSRTVIRLGPVASTAMRPFRWVLIFVTAMIPGMFIGDCIIAVTHLQNNTTADGWILFPLSLGVIPAEVVDK